MVGVASEAISELATNKKENIAPIIDTVHDIKQTLGDSTFVKTVSRTLVDTAKAGPDIVGKAAAVATDLIKVKQTKNCF